MSRLRSGETVVDYWEGNPGTTGRYVTDLLVSPDRALAFNISVPPRSQIDVFEQNGGKQLQYAAIVCYPTTAANTRANYALPVGRVPRMERGADTPLIAANPAGNSGGKWPLIVLSHGLAGSPLGNEYLQVIERFAAEGYVVFAPFHADARFSRTKIEDLSDAFYVASRYGEIAEMQALRPIGLKQGLDYFLSRSEYANAVDTDKIVGFGASLGGMAMTLVQGATMTTSLGGTERVIVRDNRYKAVVGYVPFGGYSFQAAFGESNAGTASIRVPFLGLGGTADVVAPISRSRQAIDNMAGARYFVTIEGMPHGLRAEDAPELFGWTFEFYRTYLSRGTEFTDFTRPSFDAITNFTSAADDRVQIRKSVGWSYRDELEVVQYVNLASDKYFMTGNPTEIALLDSLPAIWSRTGHRFATFRPDAPLNAPICRFWGFDNGSLNTHFFSISPSECTLVRAQPWARDEGIAMSAEPVIVTVATPGFEPGTACLPGLAKVYRLFNRTTINHQYVAESRFNRSVFGPQWAVEGPAFCAAEYER